MKMRVLSLLALVMISCLNDPVLSWRVTIVIKNQPFGVILKMMVLLLAKLLQMLISYMMRLLLRLQECKT